MNHTENEPKADLDRAYNRRVGYWALALVAILVVASALVCWRILHTLTRDTNTLTKVTDAYVSSMNNEAGSSDSALSFRAVVILEHATADIRMAGVQVAVALVAGILFTTVGLILFALGVAAPIEATGTTPTGSWKLINSSPGLVAILLGGAMVISGVLKDTRQQFSASVAEAADLAVDTMTRQPARTATGEPSIEADGPTDH